MQTPRKLPDTQVIAPTATPPAPAAAPATPPVSGSVGLRKAEEAHRSAPGSPALAASPVQLTPVAPGPQAQSPASPRSPSLRQLRPVPGLSIASVMSQNLSFEGNVRFTGTLTIDCELRGSVTTDDALIVGSSGRVQAEIIAGTVEVSGKVHGNIKAKSRVKILTGGEVYGNIESPAISMDEGVVFEGSCSRPSSPGAPQRSASLQAELERTFRATAEPRTAGG